MYCIQRSVRVFVMLITAAVGNAFVSAEEFAFYHENVLGTSMELRLECESQKIAYQAEAVALREIDRLSDIFSHYSNTSEFGRFCSLPPGSSMELSAELAGLLQRCDYWTRVSEGAFNPAVEAFSRIWKASEVAGTIPTEDELAPLVNQVSQPHWGVLDGQSRFERTGTLPMSLNAIAKGAILDSVADRLLRTYPGIGGTVCIGGDIRVFGTHRQWVSIPRPDSDAIGAVSMQRIELVGQAIATSGSSERFVTIQGRRYSHIIDPRTGHPTAHVLSASVIADDAETADVIATICSVCEPTAGLSMVESLSGVACCLVTASGEILCSSGWPSSGVQTDDSKDKAKVETPHQFNLDLEIAKPTEGGRYRRPYVAAWVEDKENFPVKTLLLFLMADNPGPRWHRDLRRWYSGDQMRLLVDDQKLIGTISKPTRNPGSYKVAWDGRDDNGKILEDGKYTLYIEAAREHGTYQLMKMPFELGNKDFEETLKGNVEIKQASVKYIKK